MLTESWNIWISKKQKACHIETAETFPTMGEDWEYWGAFDGTYRQAVNKCNKLIKEVVCS